MKLQTTIFAGPSLTPPAVQLINEKGYALLPPIKRGDLAELLDKGFRGRIVIADGVFQQVMSVGHREIMNAIAGGCEVYGVSSMGAIRAFELRNSGMCGFGKVYSLFFEFEDFMDDEVALLFESTPPYRAMSEPLVHFRECINHLIMQGKISQPQGQAIIGKIKERYFGERTLLFFKELILAHTGTHLKDLIDEFESFRCKSSDLLNCIKDLDQKIIKDPN
jgi:hypothetical protein